MPPPKKKKKEEEVMKQPSDNTNSGVIRFKVDKISTLRKGVRCSPEIEVGGVPWNAKVLMKECHGNDKLSVYLHNVLDRSTAWSFDVDFQTVLVNSDNNKNIVTKNDPVVFMPGDDWGDDLLEWKGLMGEEKGFINDDTITIEINFLITGKTEIGIIVPLADFTDPNDPRHDIALVIGGEKIYVNKGYLSLHSSVFNTMFFGELSEKNMKEIELEDVDRVEFLEMLRVIYPSYLNITDTLFNRRLLGDTNVQSLLMLADRFKIKLLLDLVEEHLISSANFQVAAKILLSDQYKLPRLKEHCLSQVETMEQRKKPLFSDGTASGLIHFEISDVSTITPSGICSNTIEVLGMPWNILVDKRNSSLGVYLNHRKSSSNIWSIDASFELSLINIGSKGIRLTKSYKVRYCHTVTANGYANFLSWKDLIDEEKGFIVGNKIVIEARFTLSNPIGIRTASLIDFTDSNDPRHDVALVIDGEKIYVSKQILAVHSLVFNTMFYGDFVEKNLKDIELKDVDREEFIMMLNMIYPSYEKITDTIAETLLKMADRFQIKMITDQVEKFLIDSKTLNVSSKLKLSDQYRLVMLQDHCLDTFKTVKDVMDLKTTDVFKELSNNLKASLLERAMKLD